MDTVDFKKWSKIPRLENIHCVITEKIDGTNGLVYIGEDGTVLAGSRNRWLTEDNDNYNFCEWVNRNKESLSVLSPGYHYGEWYGIGIQRGYGLDNRMFSLFNPGRYKGLDSKVNSLPFNTVPVVATCQLSDLDYTLQQCEEEMRGKKSYINGFTRPEGLVMFIPEFARYIKVIWDK